MSRSAVVLGMHRSGTSVVTRVINLLGLSLPPDEDLYTDTGNPTGHWESRSLIEMNDRILATFGGHQMAPPLLPTGWERSAVANELVGTARAVFDDVYSAGPWVWKDPRLCLTLPFWRRLIGAEFVVVFVARHPAQVARSLERRDGLEIEHGIAVWERYVRSALRAADGLPWTLVEYRTLATDPLGTVRSLASGLDHLGVSVAGDAQDAAAFFRPSEHHHRGTSRSALTRSQRRLLAIIDYLPEIADRFSTPRLPPETRSTRRMFAQAVGSDPTTRRWVQRVRSALRRLLVWSWS